MGCGQTPKETEAAVGAQPSIVKVSTEKLKRVTEALGGVLEKAASRTSQIALSGRYHKDKKLSDDYIVNEADVLGTGYNGSVYKAKAKSGDITYAVKDFHYRNLDETRLGELENECEMFLSMDHPKIARLVNVYQGMDKLSLVMECMEGGEVADRVLKRTYSPKDAAESVYQMLLAINYMHRHNVVHRDIKLENFMYEKTDGDNLKLIDFGFSKIFDPSVKMQLSVGTLAFVAPEVLSKSYDNKCDMWSLGVASFVLLAGCLPFVGSGPHELMKNICRAEIAKIPSDKVYQRDPIAHSFVLCLLRTNPKERLSAADALHHEFITKRSERAAKHSQHFDVDQDSVRSLCAFANASKFRRVMMSAMAWSLTQDQRLELRQMFLTIDKDKSGTITIDEFKNAINSKFTFSDTEMTELFKSMDVGGHEEVHYTDFLAAMVSTKVNMHNDLLQATFRRFDTDGSGFIEHDELKDLLQLDEIDHLIQEVDSDGDGKISFKEFMEFARKGEGHVADATDKLIDAEKDKQGSRGKMVVKTRTTPDRPPSWSRWLKWLGSKICCK